MQLPPPLLLTRFSLAGVPTLLASAASTSALAVALDERKYNFRLLTYFYSMLTSCACSTCCSKRRADRRNTCDARSSRVAVMTSTWRSSSAWFCALTWVARRMKRVVRRYSDRTRSCSDVSASLNKYALIRRLDFKFNLDFVRWSSTNGMLLFFLRSRRS